MPDRPAARAEREPLPFRPSAAGCCYSIHVQAGQWGACGGAPAVAGIWTSPRNRERWRVFGCALHGSRFEGPEWSAVGPLDDDARRELAARKARWQAALDGKGWRPEQPLAPDGPTAPARSRPSGRAAGRTHG